MDLVSHCQILKNKPVSIKRKEIYKVKKNKNKEEENREEGKEKGEEK